MSLEIVTGAAGSGKSYYLYEELIRQALAHPEQRFVVLTPDQFSMETQRRLAARHPGRVLLNIDVHGFHRLAHRVMEYCGIANAVILDEIGKSMLLRKGAELRKRDLKVFGNNLKRSGFIHRMKDLVSEFYMYGVTPDVLEEAGEGLSEDPILQAKLEDLKVFFEAFEQGKKQQEIVAEELPIKLKSLLMNCDYLEGAVVILDGFTGFTPVQYELISIILRQAASVKVAVTLDGNWRPGTPFHPYELFALSKETVEHLTDLADRNRIPYRITVCGESPEKYEKCAELDHLERHFLRYDRTPAFRGEYSGIDAVSCKNPSQEAEYAANCISRLVKRGNGLRYRDIAVVTGDLAGSAPVLRSAMHRAGIPCYIDDTMDVSNDPLVVFLKSALEVVEKGFSYESVMQNLHSGMTSLSPDELDLLDNYILGTGVRGAKRWSEELTRPCRNYEGLDMAELNRIRAKAIDPLLRFRENITARPRTIETAVNAMLILMEDVGAAERMADMSKELSGADPVKAGEYDSIYAAVEKLLTELKELLGPESYTIPEFRDVVQSGLEELRVGSLPPYLDQVLIGDIERSRRHALKALIFINMNEGIIPKGEVSGGILTDEEREILKGLGLELSPTAKETAYREQFYMYQILSSPSEYLFLSCSRTSAGGSELRPSSYLTQICRMFRTSAGEELRLTEWKKGLQTITNRADVLDAAAEGYRQLRMQDADLRLRLAGSLLNEPEDQRYLRLMMSACTSFYRTTEIGQDAAAMLYGKDLCASVSLLETYAGCPYKLFLNYGLRLRERAIFEFGGADRGTLFHTALEWIFRRMQADSISVADLSETDRKALVKDAIDAILTNDRSGILTDSASGRYYLNRWTKTLDRTMWAISNQFHESGFTPRAVEQRFDPVIASAMRIPVDHDRNILLRGKVDRLDVCETDGRCYLRIVDYKTSSHSLRAEDIYEGLQLQLMVYMNAAMSMEARKRDGLVPVPSGMYYYNISDAIIEGNANTTDEEIQNKVAKSLNMQGFQNESTRELNGPGQAGGFTEEQFALLSDHVRASMRTQGKQILDGDIRISPCKNSNGTACRWCSYGDICGFDPGMPGFRYRVLPKRKPEEIWELLDGGKNGESVD